MKANAALSPLDNRPKRRSASLRPPRTPASQAMQLVTLLVLGIASVIGPVLWLAVTLWDRTTLATRRLLAVLGATPRLLAAGWAVCFVSVCILAVFGVIGFFLVGSVGVIWRFITAG